MKKITILSILLISMAANSQKITVTYLEPIKGFEDGEITLLEEGKTYSSENDYFIKNKTLVSPDKPEKHGTDEYYLRLVYKIQCYRTMKFYNLRMLVTENGQKVIYQKKPYENKRA